MSEIILRWLEKIARGKKGRVFWALIIILILVAFVALPYIDANFLVYQRIEKRVNNLEKLVRISGTTIAEEPSLMAEYHGILQEMEEARETSGKGLSNEGDLPFEAKVKFWSGTIIGIIIAIAGLFSKNPNGGISVRFFLGTNLVACVFGLIIGAVSGYLFTFIPTLGNVWINAVLAPVIQFIFWDLLLTSPKEQK